MPAGLHGCEDGVDVVRLGLQLVVACSMSGTAGVRMAASESLDVCSQPGYIGGRLGRLPACNE